MKIKMNIKKIFTNLAFAFICIFSIGVMNVDALTVTTEQELREAVDGIKDVDGEKVTDTDTTLVELGNDIVLTSDLIIKPITDFTLDLKGNTIDGETNSKNVSIIYGSNNYEVFTTGSLTIKDTGSGSTGTIKSYKQIDILGHNHNDVAKNFALTIEGGKFYVLSDRMFELSSNDYYMKNTTFDFQVKDGYFDASVMYGILLYTDNLESLNINLKFKLDKLTFKSYFSRLIKSDKALTINDVVSADSNVKIKFSTGTVEETVTDRTLLVSEYMAFKDVLDTYDTIEITKKDGFDVENVTLNETYGYSASTPVAIPIKNRGTNPLKIENVSVDSANFIVEDNSVLTELPTVAAGTTDNTSYKVKAKTGLNAGTYTATITVTDENDKTYTSTVTLTVARKPLGDISVSKDGWTYDGTAHTGYTKSGLDSVPSDKYLIEYSIKNADEWSTTIPKTVGTYTIRLTITDPNLEEKSVESDFTIAKNRKEIRIIASSFDWTYDGKIHKDIGYIVEYNGEVMVGGKLPTGDTISDVSISATVKDVKDNRENNNEIDSYELPNYNCYSDVKTVAGTIKINPITTPIVVTADSANKAYDGNTLEKDSFTYTDEVLVTGDKLTATITGSQTYVGTSSNIVSNVKVMRDDKDITSNYTFGTHVNGTLTVTAANQTLSIADQYVRVNGKLLTSELEDALMGAYGNVSFEKKSGTAGEYNKDTIGGFSAGSSLGTVVMTAKATAVDVNGDGTAEYNETEKDFNIHVVTKETVTISGITNNQEFTYDGSVKTPTGTLTVSGDKVAVSDLEVSYVGTGSTTYSSTTAPKNAGTYKVTYKVPNTNADYVGEATFNFTIKKAQFSKVTLKHSSYIYTGEKIYLELNGFDGLYMSLLGSFGEFVPMVKNVNTYNFSVRLEDKNNYEWTDGTTNNIPLTVSVIKANPSYEDLVPTNLTGLKGQTLNDITLPDRFTWNDASTSLIVGTHTYKATYTPSDTDNYNIMNDIDVTIVTKNIFNVTTSVAGGNGTISTSYSNVVEGSTKEVTFTPNTGFMIDKVLVNDVETTVTNNKLTLTVDEDKEVVVSYKKIPFTITVVDTDGATITPDGIVAVNYGETKEFTITTNSGYRFIKVLVNNVDKTEEMTGDKLILNNITANMEIKVVVERIVYEVIEGANQKYTVNKDNEAKFRIDAEYRMFEDGGKVYVDDELVDEDNYTTEEGSTIVTLKQSYVDTLSVGEHTLKVTFADGGVATTNFTIAKVTPAIDNPKTGDNIALYITTGILSVVGLIGASVFIIRRKQEN